MASKKVNQTIFRINNKNPYDKFNLNNYNNNLLPFVINKLNYLNINTFQYYYFSNKLNLLVWTNNKEKVYTYIKKKAPLNKNLKSKNIIIIKKKRKIILPNLQNKYKINQLKLIIIKNIINKFFFKKYKVNFLDCQKLNTYCENFTHQNKQKAINLTKDYLSILKFPLSAKKIKKGRKNLLVFQLIYAGLLADPISIAKVISNALEKNKNQKAILSLIEFIISKIFLVTMNFKGIMIELNGKFLKKFGNKKIRSTKQKLIIGQHIPKQTLKINTTYGFSEAKTYLGVLSIHIWIKH